jgi:hypothetical protein
MTINLLQVTNHTSLSIKTNNLNNSRDNIVIPANEQAKHDHWLAGKNKPVEVLWERSGALIIKFWDDDWKIHYETRSGLQGSVAVDHNKDFHIIVSDAELTMTCFNGEFTPGTRDHVVVHTPF